MHVAANDPSTTPSDRSVPAITVSQPTPPNISRVGAAVEPEDASTPLPFTAFPRDDDDAPPPQNTDFDLGMRHPTYLENVTAVAGNLLHLWVDGAELEVPASPVPLGASASSRRPSLVPAGASASGAAAAGLHSERWVSAADAAGMSATRGDSVLPGATDRGTTVTTDATADDERGISSGFEGTSLSVRPLYGGAVGGAQVLPQGGIGPRGAVGTALTPKDGAFEGAGSISTPPRRDDTGRRSPALSEQRRRRHLSIQGRDLSASRAGEITAAVDATFERVSHRVERAVLGVETTAVDGATHAHIATTTTTTVTGVLTTDVAVEEGAATDAAARGPSGLLGIPLSTDAAVVVSRTPVRRGASSAPAGRRHTPRSSRRLQFHHRLADATSVTSTTANEAGNFSDMRLGGGYGGDGASSAAAASPPPARPNATLAPRSADALATGTAGAGVIFVEMLESVRRQASEAARRECDILRSEVRALMVELRASIEETILRTLHQQDPTRCGHGSIIQPGQGQATAVSGPAGDRWAAWDASPGGSVRVGTLDSRSSPPRGLAATARQASGARTGSTDVEAIADTGARPIAAVAPLPGSGAAAPSSAPPGAATWSPARSASAMAADPAALTRAHTDGVIYSDDVPGIGLSLPRAGSMSFGPPARRVRGRSQLGQPVLLASLPASSPDGDATLRRVDVVNGLQAVTPSAGDGEAKMVVVAVGEGLLPDADDDAHGTGGAGSPDGLKRVRPRASSTLSSPVGPRPAALGAESLGLQREEDAMTPRLDDAQMDVSVSTVGTAHAAHTPGAGASPRRPAAATTEPSIPQPMPPGLPPIIGPEAAARSKPDSPAPPPNVSGEIPSTAAAPQRVLGVPSQVPSPRSLDVTPPTRLRVLGVTPLLGGTQSQSASLITSAVALAAHEGPAPAQSGGALERPTPVVEPLHLRPGVREEVEDGPLPTMPLPQISTEDAPRHRREATVAFTDNLTGCNNTERTVTGTTGAVSPSRTAATRAAVTQPHPSSAVIPRVAIGGAAAAVPGTTTVATAASLTATRDVAAEAEVQVTHLFVGGATRHEAEATGYRSHSLPHQYYLTSQQAPQKITSQAEAVEVGYVTQSQSQSQRRQERVADSVIVDTSQQRRVQGLGSDDAYHATGQQIHYVDRQQEEHRLERRTPARERLLAATRSSSALTPAQRLSGTPIANGRADASLTSPASSLRGSAQRRSAFRGGKSRSPPRRGFLGSRRGASGSGSGEMSEALRALLGAFYEDDIAESADVARSMSAGDGQRVLGDLTRPAWGVGPGLRTLPKTTCLPPPPSGDYWLSAFDGPLVEARHAQMQVARLVADAAAHRPGSIAATPDVVVARRTASPSVTVLQQQQHARGGSTGLHHDASAATGAGGSTPDIFGDTRAAGRIVDAVGPEQADIVLVGHLTAAAVQTPPRTCNDPLRAAQRAAYACAQRSAADAVSRSTSITPGPGGNLTPHRRVPVERHVARLALSGRSGDAQSTPAPDFVGPFVVPTGYLVARPSGATSPRRVPSHSPSHYYRPPDAPQEPMGYEAAVGDYVEGILKHRYERDLVMRAQQLARTRAHTPPSKHAPSRQGGLISVILPADKST